MDKRSQQTLVVFAALILSATPVLGETFDAVKKKLHDQMSSVKSLSYKTHTTGTMEVSDMTITTESHQLTEAARQGDQVLSRMEAKMTTRQKIAGQDQVIDSSMLTVSDGHYNYTYSESAGQKNAIRQKANPALSAAILDPEKAFKESEKYFSYKILPDETVEGKSCYVIEMTAKGEAAQSGMGKTISHFDKATGVVIKSTGYNKEGKVITRSTTTDVKVDAPIPAERFKFKAPEGVTIQDMPAQNP